MLLWNNCSGTATGLFVSISQVIGCEDRLRNDLYCVEWGGKLYSNQPLSFRIRLFTTDRHTRVGRCTRAIIGPHRYAWCKMRLLLPL